MTTEQEFDPQRYALLSEQVLQSTKFHNPGLPPDLIPRGVVGITTYRDVLVLWDEDYDERVFWAIDDMPQVVRKQLVAIHEHKGMVEFWWKEYIPSGYENGIESDGDSWLCVGSTLLPLK